MLIDALGGKPWLCGSRSQDRNHARFTITVDYWVAMLSKRFPGKIALKHRYIDDPINHGEGETWLSGKADELLWDRTHHNNCSALIPLISWCLDLQRILLRGPLILCWDCESWIYFFRTLGTLTPPQCKIQTGVCCTENYLVAGFVSLRVSRLTNYDKHAPVSDFMWILSQADTLDDLWWHPLIEQWTRKWTSHACTWKPWEPLIQQQQLQQQQQQQNTFIFIFRYCWLGYIFNWSVFVTYFFKIQFISYISALEHSCVGVYLE